MQYCDSRDCNWYGEKRTPERQRITNTKELRIENCHGWNYIVYDKYGHTSTHS